MRKDKIWEVDLFDQRPYSQKSIKKLSDPEFWTSDTEAFLVFKLFNNVAPDSATLNLYNRDDKSLVVDLPMVINNQDVEFELTKEIIAHFGTWSAQAIFKIAGESYTSPSVNFSVARELGADLPEKLGLIQEWKTLNDEVKVFVAEIEGFTLDQFVELKMGEELQNLESNYAVKLTELQSNDATLTAQLAQTAINIKSFGAKGDGITDDTDIIKSAIEYCITNELRLYFPPGTYMIRSRGLYIDFTEEKGLEMFGAGHLSVIKLLDGQVNQRFAEMFYFKVQSNVEAIHIKDLFIDNNARGSTPPTEGFGYEQSHTFRVGVFPGFTLNSITFDNVGIKDPAADGFNNSGEGVVKEYRVINGSRVIDRTRKRSDVQMSRMPKVVIVDNFIGKNIESENITEPTEEVKFIISNSVVEGIDLAPGIKALSLLTNVTTSLYTILGYHKVIATNCKLKIGTANLGKCDHLMRGSKISNSEILLNYDETTNAVQPLDLRHVNNLLETDVSFINCDFKIDHEGDITPTGYLVTGSLGYPSTGAKKNLKKLINCTFDERAFGSVNCNRNGEWVLDDNIYGGTDRAIYVTATTGFLSRVFVNNADFRNVTGKAFQLSGSNLYELYLTGVHHGLKSVEIGRDSGALLSAIIRSNRSIFVDSLPAAAIKGDTLVLNNVASGSVSEYQAVTSAALAEATSQFVMKRQTSVIKGASTSRPTLTSRDIGYKYLDTTLSNAGKPIIWTGTQWVDMNGIVV